MDKQETGGNTPHILENEALSLAIADKGAELSRVWDKETGCERLWNADPAVWNRHAPILFPFVGKVIDGKYRVHGKTYEMKTQHGFARDLDFTCVEETPKAVSHLLRATERTKAVYPFDFRLLVRHRLDEHRPRLLHVEWEVRNDGDAPMYYAIGGHPGFLPPPGAAKEDCFLGFPGRTHLRYISANPAGFALPDRPHELALRDAMTPYGASLPETWMFEEHQVSAVQLLWPDRTPWVTLSCEDFPILAVWANAAGPFVCLEPWCGRTDDAGFEGELSEKVCEECLGPGETKRIAYRIEFHR